MKTLPFDLQQPFFKLLLEQGLLSDFEIWLYNEPSLEKHLTPDDYLELISLDFKDKRSIIDIEKLSIPYLDYSKYYSKTLIDVLLSLINQPNDLDKLAKIYNWYCQGYAFLRELATKYGLYADLYFWGEEHYGEFSETDLNEIKQQATHMYNELINGKIVLLNPPSYDDDKAFHQEFRTANCS